MGGGNITNPRQMPCSVTVTEQAAAERPRPTSRRCGLRQRPLKSVRAAAAFNLLQFRAEAGG